MISTFLDLGVEKYFYFVEKLVLLSPFWLFSQVFISLGFLKGQEATDNLKAWLNFILNTCYKMDYIPTYLSSVKPSICEFTWHSLDAVWK